MHILLEDYTSQSFHNLHEQHQQLETKYVSVSCLNHHTPEPHNRYFLQAALENKRGA